METNEQPEKDKQPSVISPGDKPESTLEKQTNYDEAANRVSAENVEITDEMKAEVAKTEAEAAELLSPIQVEKSLAHHSFFRPEVVFPGGLRNKLGKSARPLGVLIILVILVGGGLGTWKLVNNQGPKPVPMASKFKLSITAFKLVSTVPTKNATDVNTASDIVLNFSQPVAPSRLINNMFLTPKVTGTFVQGTNPDQVIFKPSVAFAEGTKVTVMLNSTVQSSRGSKLGITYEYGFSTSIPNNEVIFQDQDDLFDEVTSLASGQKETYSLQLGSDISSGAAITLYKGDITDMLNSLVYTDTSSYGVSTPTFNDLSVSTTGLTQVSKTSNITNNENYSVQQPDGLYVAVATDSSGKEVGFVWIDFSSFGVLLRQDDQNAILDAQTFNGSADVSANVKFYNLNNSVNLIKHQAVDGLTTVSMPYSQTLDVAVATYGQETAIIPVNILDSGGDIRVDQNLSTAQEIYGVTDKPSYKVGDTMHFSGYARNDDDAQYVNPGSGDVNLYVASYKGGSPLASFKAPIDSTGMFSGTATVSGSWLNSGDNFDQLQLFATSVGGISNNDFQLASFNVTNSSNAASNIEVHFSQSDYLPSNSISATILATGSNGKPLANTNIDVHVYSQDYYENDPVSDLAEFGTYGTELLNSPYSVRLDSNGQATYTISPSQLPNDGTSQEVAIEANLPGQSGVGAAGGDSAIVHQGDGVLNFGIGRTQVPAGDDLIGRIYAKHLNGTPLASSAVKYQLLDIQSNSVVAAGSVTTDSTGFAVIDVSSSKLSGNSYRLQVSASDEYGNTIQASNGYYVSSGSSDENYDTSGAELADLDISGSSGNVNVGDNLDLQINAPANIRAMVTMDRGRIYNPTMLSLNKGSNTYSFNVTSNLAPSFTLTFNYFLNGVYHSEGVQFNVSENSKMLNVKLTPAALNVSANQPTTVDVSTTNNSSGAPVVTNLIVDVISSNVYNLSSQSAPDIFQSLYNPRVIMTNSSSSLSPVGSGGGGCGGGGGDLPNFASALGITLYWQPDMSTDTSGSATISFNPPSGSWTVNVYAMSGDTQVGHSSTTINAQ